MLALDSSDLIRGDGSAASKLDYTIHGIVGVVAKQLADGQLGTSEATLYTSPSDGVVVTTITIVNTDTSARTCNLYLQPKGGTSRRIVPKDTSLAAGYALQTDGANTNIIDTSGRITYIYGPHAASHTDGTDDIQDAAADDSTKGIATFEADDFDSTTGKIDLAVSVTKASTTDSGTATPTAHDLGIKGGEGIDTSGSGTDVTITGEDASTTNKGIASFNSADFTASSGAISISATSTNAIAAAKTVKIDDFASPDDNTDLNASTSAHGLCLKGDNDTTHFLRGDISWAVAAQLSVSTTEVHSGAAPTSWTDLDLSGTIGSNSAVVMIKISCGSVGYTYAFRQNGDTDEFYTSSWNMGTSCVDVTANDHAYAIVPTDSSGVIEWTAENAANVTLDIVAYIK